MSEGSVRGDYHDVKILAADERLLLAQALWVKVEGFLSSHAVGELGTSTSFVVAFVACGYVEGRGDGWRDGIERSPQSFNTLRLPIMPSSPAGPNARAVRAAVGRPRARRRLADLQRKVAVCHEAFRCVVVFCRMVVVVVVDGSI